MSSAGVDTVRQTCDDLTRLLVTLKRSGVIDFPTALVYVTYFDTGHYDITFHFSAADHKILKASLAHSFCMMLLHFARLAD